MEFIPPQCAAQSLGPANQVINLLFQTLLSSYCSISAPEMWPKDCGENAIDGGENRDFIANQKEN